MLSTSSKGRRLLQKLWKPCDQSEACEVGNRETTMKMYIRRASDRLGLDGELEGVAGFTFEPAHFQYQANPTDKRLWTQHAWTVEINSLEDLLRLAEQTGKQGSGILLEWQPDFPPAPPRQHIPDLTIVDDYL